MTEQEKIEFLISAVNKMFHKDISNLKLTDKLSDLNLDSLDTVELQMYYEEQYDVVLPNNVNIVTVADLINIMK